MAVIGNELQDQILIQQSKLHGWTYVGRRMCPELGGLVAYIAVRGTTVLRGVSPTMLITAMQNSPLEV